LNLNLKIGGEIMQNNDWSIRLGSGQTAVSFRGKMGVQRQLRKDEIVISRTESDVESVELTTVQCVEVLGRKAWRVDSDAQQVITDLVGKLNEGKFSALEVLENLERRFESGSNGTN
jgi:hypothetical protein